jgi:ribosomal protein S18 acetylase RimI-like enzyme
MNVIRPPTPLDSAAIAELVLQSDCGMLPALFGPEVGRLIAWLLPRRANPYSASNALVIDEQEGGRVIGAVVGSLAGAARRNDIRTALLLLGWYGPGVILRYPRLARAGAALRGLRSDDFYLSHIAVLPSHRGQGTGERLLRSVEDHARALHAGRLVLDVATDNDRARAFYARMGYTRDSLLNIELGRTFAFDRVARSL